MKIERKFAVDPSKAQPFSNKVDFCVGTGRMGLALQKEYYDQLAFVQKFIGFKHIRGHGLFHDDMAIYQERRDNPWDKNSPVHIEYNFTYLDRVMDSYHKLGLRPFLELGFMPEKLASSGNRVFVWGGHTSPPRDYKLWTDLVKATLRHLISRYGDEAVEYPVEIWNEPNLPGFWENADMQAYFKLFDETFAAVKEVDPRFKVGGPAVCGGSDEVWITAFMNHCAEKKLAIDFVTRHHYTTESPDRKGHYVYQELMDPEEGFANLRTTRDIIDSHPEYKGLPIHITEFNTSYSPDNPIHDTNQNAAFLCHQLSRLGDTNESYSYWTFGDVFEEVGVPFAPFHGGFGLVANGSIPKPTFWSFVFFKSLLGGVCVHRSDEAVIVKDGETYRGVLFNPNRRREGRELSLTFEIPASGELCLMRKTVNEKTCNPLKVWHDLGEPQSLSEEQLELIKMSAYPAVSTERISADGKAELKFELPEFGVEYFELRPAPLTPDRGFDYDRAVRKNGI